MNYVICRFYIYAIETTFQTQNLLYTKAISEFLFKSVTQAGLQVYSVYLFIYFKYDFYTENNFFDLQSNLNMHYKMHLLL